MENMNYKPNSHAHKAQQAESAEERKKVEKVVTGVVKTKKKSEASKLASAIISEDARNVKSYIVDDVLLPAVKNTILDIIVDSAKMIFGGGRSKKDYRSGKVSYRDYYDQGDRGRASEPRVRNAYNYDDIILETRGEAEDVLARMDELMDAYGVVTVADLYDLVGITGNYTDYKYGWSNLRNAKVVRVREGYILELPKVLPIG